MSEEASRPAPRVSPPGEHDAQFDSMAHWLWLKDDSRVIAWMNEDGSIRDYGWLAGAGGKLEIASGMRARIASLEAALEAAHEASSAMVAQSIASDRDLHERAEKAEAALAARARQLAEADALFKSLGQVGHILDEVLEVMCKGREVCGGVRITQAGPTSLVVELDALPGGRT